MRNKRNNYKDNSNKKAKNVRGGKINDKDARSKEYSKAKVADEGRENNPNDYFTSEELARQASQLSFQQVLGSDPLIDSYRVPTIMAIKLNPCPGYSYANSDFVDTTGGGQLWQEADPGNKPYDGINLMAAKTYTLLSTFSGRTSVYQPCDVGIMELAVASISEFSEHLRRAFGVALTYNGRNRSIPRELLVAMQVNPDDLSVNLADYKARFNMLMAQMNQIPLLDNIGFIKKSRDIYQRVYMDGVSSMSQLYLFIPNSVWLFDESTYSTGSVLITKPITYDTMGNHLSLLESMIRAILGSSSLNVVYADLLNLANKVKVATWQFDYLAENYVVLPEYNANALLQIHNMTMFGEPDAWNLTSYPFDIGSRWRTSVPGTGITNTYYLTRNNDVCCDANTGMIIYNPVFSALNTIPGAHKVVIDMPSGEPTPVDVIESMRMTTIWSGTYFQLGAGSGESRKAFLSLPDHYAVGVVVYDGVNGAPITFNYSDVTSLNTHIDAIAKFTQFAMAPLVYDMSTSGTDVDRVEGSLEYFTTVGYDYLNRINRLMYEGLFDFRL